MEMYTGQGSVQRLPFTITPDHTFRGWVNKRLGVFYDPFDKDRFTAPGRSTDDGREGVLPSRVHPSTADSRSSPRRGRPVLSGTLVLRRSSDVLRLSLLGGDGVGVLGTEDSLGAVTFDPVVSRLRVVIGSGLELRLDESVS